MPPLSSFSRVGVFLLLCASMLALMRPAVQTLSRSARRDRSLCCRKVLHLQFSTPSTIWHRKPPHPTDTDTHYTLSLNNLCCASQPVCVRQRIDFSPYGFIFDHFLSFVIADLSSVPERPKTASQTHPEAPSGPDLTFFLC